MSGKNNNRNNLPADRFWVRLVCGILGFVMVFAIVLMLIQTIASSASYAPASVSSGADLTDTEISVGLCYGDTAVQSYTLASAGGFLLYDSSDNLLFESSNTSLILCSDSKLTFVGDEISVSDQGIPVTEEYHVQINAFGFRTGSSGSGVDNPALINPPDSSGQGGMEKLTKNTIDQKLQDLLDSDLLTPYTNSIFPAYSKGSYSIRLGQFSDRESAEAFMKKLDQLLVMDASVVSSNEEGFTVIDGNDHSVVFEIATSDRSVHLKAKQGSLTDLNAKNYNGYFTFIRKQTGMPGLNVVNTFSMEDYISAILPLEVSEDCPGSAAMAMAVVLRTNAYRMLGRHDADGFDVCTDPHCHVYNGNLVTESKLKGCVEETAGQILLYGKTPIHALYNVSSGDSIVSAEEALGLTDYPYLTSKKTVWESSAEWEADLSPDALYRMLVRSGYGNITSDIVGVTVDGQSEDSGYVTRLVLTDRFGETAVIEGSEKIRQLFGANLPSAKFTVSVSDGSDGIPYGTFRFVGSGSGSGIGLSITGAMALADMGYTYDAILLSYYVGVTIHSQKE
ncbi:MAG: SpoIID/LytB domain-containing protein [Eubacteriales bacterium]